MLNSGLATPWAPHFTTTSSTVIQRRSTHTNVLFEEKPQMTQRMPGEPRRVISWPLYRCTIPAHLLAMQGSVLTITISVKSRTVAGAVADSQSRPDLYNDRFNAYSTTIHAQQCFVCVAPQWTRYIQRHIQRPFNDDPRTPVFVKSLIFLYNARFNAHSTTIHAQRCF